MGGVETYVRALLDQLGRAWPDHEFVLVTGDYNDESLRSPWPNLSRSLFVREGVLARAQEGAESLYHLRAMAWGVRVLRTALHARLGRALSGLIREERLDLWFCPLSHLLPCPAPVASVVTMFDLQHEHYPRFFSATELSERRRLLPRSCALADRVIAFSEFTRQDLARRYGVPLEKITAVPIGVAAPPAPSGVDARVAAVRERYRLAERYLVYPSHFWRHKNHARLLEAFARYRSRATGDLDLVLCGSPMDARGALAELLERDRRLTDVRLLGHVPGDDLQALVRGSSGMVFPSLFEGFGIPLVEAMGLGCPVAASRAAAIPEVVGDAAILFDPEDVSDMARAIERLVEEPGLAAELARRGVRRAALFTPERMARETWQVFLEALT
jgi:glycosyltransferase involved in cell wall biosynthesis